MEEENINKNGIILFTLLWNLLFFHLAIYHGHLTIEFIKESGGKFELQDLLGPFQIYIFSPCKSMTSSVSSRQALYSYKEVEDGVGSYVWLCVHKLRNTECCFFILWMLPKKTQPTQTFKSMTWKLFNETLTPLRTGQYFSWFLYPWHCTWHLGKVCACVYTGIDKQRFTHQGGNYLRDYH